MIPVDPAPVQTSPCGVPADPVDPGQFLCPIAGAKIIAEVRAVVRHRTAVRRLSAFHTGIDLLAEYGI